jgi:sarcosine oxidase subunit gamma
MPASLTLANLSALPRIGFKGRGTIDAMKTRGFAVEATPNRAFRQADGSLCMVLAPGEVFLLAAPHGDGGRFDALLRDWRIEDEERTYPLLRRDSHAWFAVIGDSASDFFSRICGIDLRLHRFADLSIAQTSVAKLNAIIVRADAGQKPVFHCLADSASADYLGRCLQDAAGEFGVSWIGPDEWKDLAAQRGG